MHKLNICNSGFALICTPDTEYILFVYSRWVFRSLPAVCSLWKWIFEDVLMYLRAHKDCFLSFDDIQSINDRIVKQVLCKQMFNVIQTMS